MSGTSQAAAVVSGVVALMLEAEPFLTPNDVKCRLMASARPAVDDDGSLAYSIFHQGAGQVDAYGAVFAPDSGCANRGLDVHRDLTGAEHYGGRANMDENGAFYIEGLEGYLWSDGFLWSDGYLWSDFIGFDLDGYLWSDSLPETMGVNSWVEQE